jgi:hypothetical protein
MLDRINKDLKYYEVRLTDKAVGELGELVEGDGEPVGYKLVNKITGITEHTSIFLAGVIYQAAHFDSTVKGALSAPEPVAVESADDVIPLLQ